MANKQHAQFSDENGNLFYLESETEDVLDPSGKPLSDGGDLSEASVKFSVDTSRKLPQSGGRFKAFLGSIVKYLTDLGAAAYLAVANNDTTTQPGFVGDARVLKQHRDAINQLSSELYAPVSGTGAMSIAQAVTHICENFVGRQRSARGRFACADFIGGFDIVSDESGNCSGTIVSESEALSYSFFRRAGADAVLKKLGDGEFLAAVPYNTSRTPNGDPIPFDLSTYSGEVIIAFAFIWAYGVSLGITEITFSPEPEEYLYKAPDAYTMGGSWGYNVPFVIRINVDQIPNKTLYVNHKSNGQMRGCQYFIFQV